MTLHFRRKFGFAEAVLGWMLEESAIDPTFQGNSRHFFEKERATRLENPPNFRNAPLPVRHVVQRAEIKHHVEARIRKGQSLRIPLHQSDAPRVLALKPPPRTFDLEWV